MNIFAKVIFTSHPIIKEILIERLQIPFEQNLWETQIYKKTTPEESLIVIFAPANNFEEAVIYVKDNYEIIKFLCIGIGIPSDTLDLKMWDVMIPNTFINTKNEVIFNEYVTDQNYDLKTFWLILNGICLSLEKQIESEEELLEIKENFACEIMDFEAYYQSSILDKYELWQKSVIIKSLWTLKEELRNGVDIWELML